MLHLRYSKKEQKKKRERKVAEQNKKKGYAKPICVTLCTNNALLFKQQPTTIKKLQGPAYINEHSTEKKKENEKEKK